MNNVINMMEEKKDEQLQKAFEGYFDGNEAPKIDLGRAKAELEGARRRRQRGRRISAVLSACAAFALVLALTFTVLPMFLARSGGDMSQAPASPDDPTGLAPAPGDNGDVSNAPQSPSEDSRNPVYSLFAVTAEEKSYKELRGTFSSYMNDFAAIEADGFTVCRYSLYTYDGVAVMIGAEITNRSDEAPFTAIVYTDLSGGRYKAKELAKYSELPQESGYGISTEHKGIEYLSLIHWRKNGEKYAEVSSPSEAGAQVFMNYFL
ncbi:MAG: hypothetical protein K2N84_06195 [Clostridia bacterium]|nr:hypothetical protein [Clostridia bacterium]